MTIQMTTHGTFLAVYADGEFATAAIDSRENRNGKPFDRICKITALDGQTVFLSQGIARYKNYSASEIAKTKFQGQPTPLNLERLAEAWGDGMVEFLPEVAKTDPGELNKMGSEPASGFFLGHNETGRVSVIRSYIERRNTDFQARTQPAKPVDFFCTGLSKPTMDHVFGGMTPEEALLAAIVPTSDKVTECAKRVQLCVRWAIDRSNDPEIGGPVATIILERGKRWRWFEPPNFCLTWIQRVKRCLQLSDPSF